MDPLRDVNTMRSEMLLTDLLTVEARLEKLRSEWPKRKGDERKVNEQEQELLDRFHVQLSAERPLRELGDSNSDEFVLIRGFGLFTLRPELIVVNTDEGAAVPAGLDATAGSAIAFPGALEAEIAQLAAGDRDAFRQSSVSTNRSPGVVRWVHLSASQIRHRGEDEVSAPGLPVGATRGGSGGTIHGFARGLPCRDHSVRRLCSTATSEGERAGGSEWRAYLVVRAAH